MEEKKKEIRISVRNLVEFILRSGDLDNSSGGFGERDAMHCSIRLFSASRTMRTAGYWKSFSASPTINIRYGVSVC